MSAPTDLEQLSHGRGQLRPAPAASIWRIDVALGHPVDINRAYASWSQQYIYYRAYQNYLNGGPWAPLALHPDLSWHCKGMAVDTDESPRTVPSTAQVWADNGWRFEVQSEPWHGQYYTSLDKNYGKPASDGSTPFPTPDDPAPTPPPVEPEEEDEDMAKNSGFKYTRSSDGKPIVLLCNTVSGWEMEFQEVAAVVPNGISGVSGTLDAGTFPVVGEPFIVALKASLAKVRPA